MPFFRVGNTFVCSGPTPSAVCVLLCFVASLLRCFVASLPWNKKWKNKNRCFPSLLHPLHPIPLSLLHPSTMDTSLNSTLSLRKGRLLETALTYFKFGSTTFGGPAAHIGMLHEEVVTRRKWISNEQFTKLYVICQALPGPSSTELVYSVSLVRSGFLCACLVFLLWR